MTAHPAPRIADCFADVIDPRLDRTKHHRLLDIITIALCAVISGAETWVEVEHWGRAKQDWLTEWLGLPHGIPSHDTFGRVFGRIAPDQFETGFLRWVQAIAVHAPHEVIALDGKTVRRSGSPRAGQRPLHLVSAWASDQRLVLAQAAVTDKANEITALPLLLERLVLTDQIVTIDAIGCQRTIATQIIKQGGEYVLAVKGNQAELYDDVRDCFTLAQEVHEMQRTVEKGHGRLETRVCRTIADPAVMTWLDPADAWAGLRSIAMVEATRLESGTETPTTQVRYYVSSLPGAAAQIAQAVRSHWGIENSLHWVLDMAFREDESRARIGHSAENLAMLRKLALTLIRQDPTRTHGVKTMRMKAAWDTTYLLRLLGAD